MFTEISNFYRYNLTIVILKSVELLDNLIMYISSKIDSNLNSSIYFF